MTSILSKPPSVPTPKTVSFGDQVLNSKMVPYMRTRNVEFTCKRLRPFTRVYPFFSGVDFSSFVIPKLLEITMTSGVFQVGETVIGSLDQPTTPSLQNKIVFRVSQQNHKYGDYRSPSDVYTTNPYDTATIIPESYSATSTILNVDTYSLANQPQGQFGGRIFVGMKLKGQTSQAEAIISDVKLVTDQIGVVIGSFFIPDGNLDVNPRFECGTKVFRVTSSSTNSQIFGTYSTSAEEKYFAEGYVNTVQENVIVTRPVRIELPQDQNEVGGPGNENPPPTTPPSSGSGSSGKSSTTIYYNAGAKPLKEPGAAELKNLMQKAGFTGGAIKPGMSKAAQEKAVAKFNNSAYAKNNNVKVSTDNKRAKRK
jgi:hypothetical protein